MIAEETIQEVKNINLVDVIDQYVKLKKRGSEYVGLCPFHDEMTPSFYVNPNKGYKCFGCEESGANAIDFLMSYEGKEFVEAVEQLAGMAGISIDDSVPSPKPVTPKRKPIQRPEPIRVDYIPKEILSKNLKAYNRNILYKFFIGLFGENTTNELFNKYHVGSFSDGTTMFVQTDINGNYRQIKKISYKEDGHRNKADNPLIIGKQIAKSDNLKQCFFGEHLTKDNDKSIGIVESEKTAMIASVHYPDFIWIATGGKSGCSMVRPDVNKVLRGRNIHLFPDIDGIDNWKEQADELREQGYRVAVNDVMATYPQWMGTKADIADILVNIPVADVPKWFVDAEGILQQHESDKMTDAEYLDKVQKNFDNSGVSTDEYIRGTNGGLASECECRELLRARRNKDISYSEFEDGAADICLNHKLEPAQVVDFINNGFAEYCSNFH